MVDENSDVVFLEDQIADDTNSTVGRAKDPSWSLGRAQGIGYILGQQTFRTCFCFPDLVYGSLGITTKAFKIVTW